MYLQYLALHENSSINIPFITFKYIHAENSSSPAESINRCIFGSVKETKESLCLSVCLSVFPGQTCLKSSSSSSLGQSQRQFQVSFRSVSGQFQVSFRSVSGQFQVSLGSVSSHSQVILRSVSSQSQVSLEALLPHFVIQLEPKILRLVNLHTGAVFSTIKEPFTPKDFAF